VLPQELLLSLRSQAIAKLSAVNEGDGDLGLGDSSEEVLVDDGEHLNQHASSLSVICFHAFEDGVGWVVVD